MPARVETPPADRAEPPRADPPRIRVWHVSHPATVDDTLNRVIIPRANEEPRDGAGSDAQGVPS